MTAPNLKNSTPAAAGYRWPAEWEPHAATWLSWPRNPDTWPGRFEAVPDEYAQFVKILADYEPVHILAGGQAVMTQARNLVGALGRVQLWDLETNDAWIRDYGPTFLVGDQKLPPALIDWQYNAWGGKYPPWDRDNAVNGILAERLGRRVFSPAVVLEGGSIEGNGCGTVLTTSSCLLSPQRNAGVTREDVERWFRDYLAARQVLWLSGHGIAGDDTDGHIDQLARFVNPTTVVAASCRDPRDENFEPLSENLRRLAAMRDQDGRPLTVLPLPCPPPLYEGDHRLPASYCNFYIANGVVVVPAFGADTDQPALDLLQRLFPDRHVRPSPARTLVWGLGAFHCLSQQEPALG